MMRGPSLFQSTLPARGATNHTYYISPHGQDFNPRSPHGERRLAEQMARLAEVISIHAPRTGSDRNLVEFRLFPAISIHAPRTGSDTRKRLRRPCRQAFQSTLPARGATRCVKKVCKKPEISIHAPRTGSDPIWRWMARKYCSFQSTLPARGATLHRAITVNTVEISIHAPRTGSDCTVFCFALSSTISIHAPRTGSDNQKGLNL